MLLSIFLLLSILAGELIKFPLSGNLGPTLLDLAVFLLSLIGIIKLKFKLKKPPLSLNLGLLFVLVCLLSLIFTPLHLQAIEYLVSFSYTVRFLLYLIFALVLFTGAFPNVKKNISQTLMFSGVGIAILGLLQFIFLPDLSFLQSSGWDPHYFRTVSTFLDPNFAGAFFVLTLMLLIRHSRCLFCHSRECGNLIKNKILIFIPVYLALLTTFSRSSYAMFLFSGLTLSFLKKSKTLFFSILLLFLLLLLGFQIYAQLVAKPRGVDRAQSASFRLDTWQDGLEIFRKSPILGVGFNAYKYAVREYNLENKQFLGSRGSSTNDSSLLYTLATTGIVGLVIYIFFLLSLVKRSKNNQLLMAAIIGLLPHSFFANSLFYPFILIWIFLKEIDTES